MINESVELKNLQTQVTKTEAELRIVRDEEKQALAKVKEINDKVSRMHRRLENLRKQIKVLKANAKEVVVSEHALLRYLERIKGVDLDAIRREMIPERTAEAIKKIRSGTFTTSSCTLKVRDGVVNTVLEIKAPAPTLAGEQPF